LERVANPPLKFLKSEAQQRCILLFLKLYQCVIDSVGTISGQHYQALYDLEQLPYTIRIIQRLIGLFVIVKMLLELLFAGRPVLNTW
jgi:hypothetical protein